jgi:PBSX family phage terminase large subunit
MFKKTDAQIKAIALLNGEQKWTLLYGGSRSGKTFILVYALVIRALKAPHTRHVIFRLRFNHIKASIFQDTLPKVLEVCFPGLPAVFNYSDYTVTFPNGSMIAVAGLDDKDRTEKILGQEFSTIYFNECSQIPYSSVQTALTRLAQKSSLKNKVYFDANPPTKSHWMYKMFVQHIEPENKTALPHPEMYGIQRMNPTENAENLPSDYIDTILGSLTARKRARFRDGEWLDDAEGALWNRDMINASRVINAPKDMVRIVIGVDPAVTAREGSDSTGIVVAGVDGRGHYYVMADRTVEKASPNIWATAISTAYTEYEVDFVVGETNNGGDLVEMNIRRTNANIRYKGVHASRGKIVRAEPIAGLYEQGRVHHVGEFPELEDQMCSYAPQVQDTMDSPDRMDALVWALTELSGMNASHIRATGRSIK